MLNHRDNVSSEKLWRKKIVVRLQVALPAARFVRSESFHLHTPSQFAKFFEFIKKNFSFVDWRTHPVIKIFNPEYKVGQLLVVWAVQTVFFLFSLLFFFVTFFVSYYMIDLRSACMGQNSMSQIHELTKLAWVGGTTYYVWANIVTIEFTRNDLIMRRNDCNSNLQRQLFR